MLANIQLQGAKLTDWPQLFCFEVVKQTTAPAIAVHLWLWHSFPSSTIHSEFLQPFPIQSLVTQILIPKETKHLIVTPFLVSTCFTLSTITMGLWDLSGGIQVDHLGYTNISPNSHSVKLAISPVDWVNYC